MTKLAQTYGIYSIFDFSCKLSILPSVCTDKQGSYIAAWFEGKFLGHHKPPVILATPNMCLRGTTQWQHQQQRQHRQLQRQQQQPKQKHQRQRLRARHVLLKNKSNCCFRSNQVFFASYFRTSKKIDISKFGNETDDTHSRSTSVDRRKKSVSETLSRCSDFSPILATDIHSLILLSREIEKEGLSQIKIATAAAAAATKQVKPDDLLNVINYRFIFHQLSIRPAKKIWNKNRTKFENSVCAARFANKNSECNIQKNPIALTHALSLFLSLFLKACCLTQLCFYQHFLSRCEHREDREWHFSEAYVSKNCCAAAAAGVVAAVSCSVEAGCQT